MRAGFTEGEKNAPELAKRLEAAGAAMLTVHGRTREQYYAGTADWDIIRQVKEAVSIPVIGNGDVVSGESAARMLRETGCDGMRSAGQPRAIPGFSGKYSTIWRRAKPCRRRTLKNALPSCGATSRWR